MEPNLYELIYRSSQQHSASYFHCGATVLNTYQSKSHGSAALVRGESKDFYWSPGAASQRPFGPVIAWLNMHCPPIPCHKAGMRKRIKECLARLPSKYALIVRDWMLHTLITIRNGYDIVAIVDEKCAIRPFQASGIRSKAIGF